MTIATVLLLVLAFQDQTIIRMQDFPVPFNGRATVRLKGPVHTILTIQQRGEKVFATIVEVYDQGGNLVEELASNAGPEFHTGAMVRLGGRSLFVYGSDNKLITEKNFSPEGQYTSYEKYVYDSEDRLVEKILYSLDGKQFERLSYKYLASTRELEMIRKVDYAKGAKPPAKYLIAFNEKGQAINWREYDATGALSKDSISFEYDERGNVLKEAHCCTYCYAYRYSYKFDKHGNWIEQQTASGPYDDVRKEEANKDWMYTYRIITYYSDDQEKP